MGADLYESYCGSILATAALGAAAFIHTGDTAMQFKAVIAPMLIAAVGYSSFYYRYLRSTYQGECEDERPARFVGSRYEPKFRTDCSGYVLYSLAIET